MAIPGGFDSLEKFKGMKDAGYLQNAIHTPFKEMKISQELISLGEVETGKTLYLHCNEAFHLTLIGQTRLGGKTSLLRRIMDGAFLSGWAMCWLDDTKNEIRSSKLPQQGKMANYLGKDDIAQGLPMKVYRFNFFMKFFNQQLPEENELFTIGFKDLELEELLFAMGFNKMATKDHANAISVFFNEVDSLQELRVRVEKDQMIKKGVKRDISNSINLLLKYEIFGEKTTDFCKAFNDFVVVFNIEGYENVGGKDTPTFPLIYLKIITRMILDAKEKKVIKRKRMGIIIDEAREFFDSKDNVMYKIMHEVISEKTYLGIHVMMSFQDLEQLKEAEFILNQSRYILFASTLSIDNIKKFYEYMHVYDFHPAWKRDLSEIIRNKRKNAPAGRKLWGHIDKIRAASHPDFFIAYSSLSYHMPSRI